MRALLLACALAPSLASAAPFDGLYYAASDPGRSPAREFLVAAPDGVWVFGRAGARLVPRGQLPLIAPSAKGKPWRLARKPQPLTQLVDPFLARLMAGLKGRHVLALIDLETGKPKPDTLTIDDGIFVRLESPKPERGQRECVAGMLVHDPTENAERPIDPAPRQPAPGKLGARTYLAIELGEECPEKLDKTNTNSSRGLIAGAHLFARSDGQLQGVQLVGYMYSALFAPAGTPPEALKQMLRSVAEEIGHQAE
jgi:hypothetical protein